MARAVHRLGLIDRLPGPAARGRWALRLALRAMRRHGGGCIAIELDETGADVSTEVGKTVGAKAGAELSAAMRAETGAELSAETGAETSEAAETIGPGALDAEARLRVAEELLSARWPEAAGDRDRADAVR